MARLKQILILLFVLTMYSNVNAQENSIIIHTVNKGQTLYSISKLYNTTVEEIVRMNPGSESTLSIGQELRILRTVKENSQKTIVNKDDDGRIYHLA